MVWILYLNLHPIDLKYENQSKVGILRRIFQGGMNMDDETMKANCLLMYETVNIYRSQDYVKAYENIKKIIAKDEVPRNFMLSCAWIIYKYVKQMTNRLSLENLNICADFFKLNLVSEPSLVRSMFLVQVIELSKTFPNFDFLLFCKDFNLGKLRQEDYVGNDVTLGGKTMHYESLAERLATRIYNVMKATNNRQYATLLMPFFKEVRAKCPANKFIDMYIGLMCYWMGEIVEARKMFVNILLNAPQWYIWKNMVLVTDVIEEKIAFLCKAMTMINDERYKGNMHLQLAAMLQSEDSSHAAMEIATFFETYRKNNWRICGDAYILQNKLKGVAASSDSMSFYTIYAKRAEELIYGDIDSVEMKFVREITLHGKRKVVLCATNSKTSVIVTPSEIGEGKNIGDVFSVRYNMVDNKPKLLTLSFLRHTSSTDISRLAESRLKINGIVSLPHTGGFAFIDKKYYVPDKLRSHYRLTDGQKVQALVAQTDDGRWRVVKILKS